jgi:hypothetical protein
MNQPGDNEARGKSFSGVVMTGLSRKHRPRFEMELTEVEREVVGLWVVCGSLDSLVNHALLKLDGTGGTKEVHFETATHQQLFSILLLDFLEMVDKNLTGVEGSCLEILDGACRAASFNQKDSVKYLRKPLTALRKWLDKKITVPTPRPFRKPKERKQLVLKIQRRESVYICGNISKHNLARLTGAAKRLAAILNRHGVQADMAKALLLLDDFYERFHDDIFNYHSTVIAELLNNVCWGLHDYLSPEYLRAKVSDASDPIKYCYNFPKHVSNDIVKCCYVDLMNWVRRKPCMERFIANSLFKLRY